MTHAPPTSLINLLLQGARWVRDAARPDHGSLFGGTYTNSQYSGRKHIYIVVALAPSRRFRRPRPVLPERALAFLGPVVPGLFSLPPAQSTRAYVAFEDEDERSSPPGWEPRAAARIWANGRVELFIRIQSRISEERLAVDLLDACRPIHRLATVVAAGDYRRLFRLRSRWRRMDWFIVLGSAISAEAGWHPWDDLDFPGRRPTHRARNPFAAAPVTGLAADRLRGISQATTAEEVVRRVLDDLLTESGWLSGTPDAITDVIAALRDG